MTYWTIHEFQKRKELKVNMKTARLAMLAIVGSMQAEKYATLYPISLRHNGDSTALYQRVATGNPNEPYTTGAIVRWLHCPHAWYPDEPEYLIAEREFGIYEKGKDLFVTVTLDGQQYFISAYALGNPDNTAINWVYESLPNHDSGIPWGKIILFGIIGLVVYWFYSIAKNPSRSSSSGVFSSSGSSSDSWEEERRRKEEERREKQQEEARKRKEEEERNRGRWREQLKREGKW